MRIIYFMLMIGCIEVRAQYSTYLSVSQDGSGDFESIQSAINATKAFPDKKITIFIKNGIYREKVRIYAWNTNLTLTGESRDSTIITWNDHFEKMNLGRNSTFHTYTLQVEANDVTLENLTVRNTAGPVGQAVALHIDADRVLVKNCSITGHQDTLYLAGEGHRQLFENCFISGTTDFIFGAATSVFSACMINSRANSYITAASTPKSSRYGFVFINCELTGEAGVDHVYLGRPWRPYAQTVFINCNMNDHIRPKGWHNWGSVGNELTAYYGEYASYGKGANPQERVAWSKQLSMEEASQYSIQLILRDWNYEY